MPKFENLKIYIKSLISYSSVSIEYRATDSDNWGDISNAGAENQATGYSATAVV